MRKTMRTVDVITHANNMLANSQDHMTAERQGIIALAETLLHDADAYAGYQYLDSAGVNHEGWNAAWDSYRAIAEIRKANNILTTYNDQPRWSDYCKDDTRRQFIVSAKLR